MSQNNEQAKEMSKREEAVQPDPEVVEKGERRQFSKIYKIRILSEAKKCQETGEKGALLRREGLYGSHLSKWRQEEEEGRLEIGGSSKEIKERRVKTAGLRTRLSEMERENAQLRSQLVQAEAIMAAQKKLVKSFESCYQQNKHRKS